MYSNPAFNGPAASLGCPLSVNSGNLATPVDLPNGQSNVMAKGVFHLASSALRDAASCRDGR